MFRPHFILLAASLAVLASQAAANEPIAVQIPHKVRGPDGTERTEYRAGLILATSRQLVAPGDRNDGTILSESEFQRLRALERQFFPNPRPQRPALYTAHRSTGGNSPAAVQSMVFYADSRPRSDGLRPIGLLVKFSDFKREGGSSKGDPIRGAQGFETVDYFKTLRVADVQGAGETQRVTIDGGSGVGPYDFAPMPLPRPNTFPAPADQRFVLDFGRNPTHVDGEPGSSAQLFYRVYVARVEGGDAIIIRPDSLQNLQRARQGQRVPVSYYRVPLALLRVAGPGAEGDALLRQAGSNFVRDTGAIGAMAVADGEPRFTVDGLFRANAFTGGRVDTVVGGDIHESMTSFVQGFDGIERAMEAERARRQRPQAPGETAQPAGEPGAPRGCTKELGGLT